MTTILTVADVATLMHCKPATVIDKLRSGLLPGVKFGRTWVCPRDPLMQALGALATQNLALRCEPLPIVGQPAPKRGRKRTEPPCLS